MIHHRFYEAPEADVADLIANHIAGRFVTVGADGTPHVGVFPFLHRAGCAENGMYAGMLRRLTLVRLSIRRARSKFKLGQQRPVEMRQRIIAELRQRNRPADHVAAEAVSRMIAG